MSGGCVLASRCYRITNFVCKGKFNLDRYDEISLADCAFLGKYDPSRFSALIVKTSHGESRNITGLIFRNGKINVLGIREEEHIEWAANYFADLLDIPIVPHLQICAISASFKLDVPSVPLLKFALALEGSTYEPELIPCVMYKRYGLNFCIFSGSTVCVTGGSSICMLREGSEQANRDFEEALWWMEWNFLLVQ